MLSCFVISELNFNREDTKYHTDNTKCLFPQFVRRQTLTESPFHFAETPKDFLQSPFYENRTAEYAVPIAERLHAMPLC